MENLKPRTLWKLKDITCIEALIQSIENKNVIFDILFFLAPNENINNNILTKDEFLENYEFVMTIPEKI